MQIHFFAAARAAAGTAQIDLEVDRLPSPSLAALRNYLIEQLKGTTPSGQTLADILPRCTFLLDGLALQAQDFENPLLLLDGQRLDILPPFAGG